LVNESSAKAEKKIYLAIFFYDFSRVHGVETGPHREHWETASWFP
jgi:hypothetical protein